MTGYLPAGEAFDRHAFAVTCEVLTRYPDIEWLTGQEVTRMVRYDHDKQEWRLTTP